MTESQKWRAKAGDWLSVAESSGEGEVRRVLIHHASEAMGFADELDAMWIAALTGDKCRPNRML